MAPVSGGFLHKKNHAMTTRRGIPVHVLEWLRDLGSAPAPDSTPAILAKLRPFDQINRQHWSTWDAVTAEMTQPELVTLAKGLVRAEKEHGWCGGSVASAIWVFRSFARRFPEASDALAEWMLRHSDNPYVPFGNNRGNARSLSEYRGYQDARVAYRNASAAKTIAEQELRKLRESCRRRMASYRTTIHTAATAARRELLDQLRRCSISERMAHIAWDDSRPLAFYPVDLLDGFFDSTAEFDSELLQVLVAKAKQRRTGAWAGWVRQLRVWCKENPEMVNKHGLRMLDLTNP